MNNNLFPALTSNPPGPTRTLSSGQHKHFRELVRDATKLDRHILTTELLAFNVQAGEATNNANKVSTRLNDPTVRYIQRFAADYDTTISVLIREAVEYAVTNNLFSAWHPLPDSTEEDHE